PTEPGRAELKRLVLHLRVPAGHRLVAAKADGRPVPIDATSQTVRLGALRKPVTVHARFAKAPVHAVAHAEVTDVRAERTLAEPGETIRLEADLETLGADEVRGQLRAEGPGGWRIRPARSRFSVEGDGRYAWKVVPVDVTVPRHARPGTYLIRLIADP